MTKTAIRRGAAILALLLVLGTAPPVALPQEEEGRPSADELSGMVDAYVLSKLQDALGLSDEQFGRMVVAQKKLQDARRSHRRERMEVLRQMRQSLRRDDAGEEELLPLLTRHEELRDRFAQEEKERYRDIDAILDVRQRARYRILEAEIERRLQQLIRQSGERRERPRSPFRDP
jgi:Spy/CpxP family protein refolding chaperone